MLHRAVRKEIQGIAYDYDILRLIAVNQYVMSVI